MQSFCMLNRLQACTKQMLVCTASQRRNAVQQKQNTESSEGESECLLHVSIFEQLKSELMEL